MWKTLCLVSLAAIAVVALGASSTHPKPSPHTSPSPKPSPKPKSPVPKPPTSAAQKCPSALVQLGDYDTTRGVFAKWYISLVRSQLKGKLDYLMGHIQAQQIILLVTIVAPLACRTVPAAPQKVFRRSRPSSATPPSKHDFCMPLPQPCFNCLYLVLLLQIGSYCNMRKPRWRPKHPATSLL